MPGPIPFYPPSKVRKTYRTPLATVLTLSVISNVRYTVNVICSAKTTPQNYTYHCQKSPLFKQHYFSSVRDPSRGENMPRHKTPEMKQKMKFINSRTHSERARIVQISLSSRIKWARGYGKRRCCYKKRVVSWWRETDVENLGELARFSRAFCWLVNRDPKYFGCVSEDLPKTTTCCRCYGRPWKSDKMTEVNSTRRINGWKDLVKVISGWGVLLGGGKRQLFECWFRCLLCWGKKGAYEANILFTQVILNVNCQ